MSFTRIVRLKEKVSDRAIILIDHRLRNVFRDLSH